MLPVTGASAVGARRAEPPCGAASSSPAAATVRRLRGGAAGALPGQPRAGSATSAPVAGSANAIAAKRCPRGLVRAPVSAPDSRAPTSSNGGGGGASLSRDDGGWGEGGPAEAAGAASWDDASLSPRAGGGAGGGPGDPSGLNPLEVAEEFVDAWFRGVGMGVAAAEDKLRALCEGNIILFPDRLLTTHALQGLDAVLKEINAQHQEYRRVHYHRLASAVGRSTTHNGSRRAVYVLCDFRMQDVGGLAGHPATFRISRGHCLFKLEVGRHGRVTRGWARRQLTHEEREGHVRDYVHVYPASFPSDRLHLANNGGPRRAAMEAAARAWVHAHSSSAAAGITPGGGGEDALADSSAAWDAPEAGGAPGPSAPGTFSRAPAPIADKTKAAPTAEEGSLKTLRAQLSAETEALRSHGGHRHGHEAEERPPVSPLLSADAAAMATGQAGGAVAKKLLAVESSYGSSMDEPPAGGEEHAARAGADAQIRADAAGGLGGAESEGLPDSLRRLAAVLGPSCRLMDAYGVYPAPLPGSAVAAADGTLSRRSVMPGPAPIVHMLKGVLDKYDVEPRLLGLAAAPDHNAAFLHYTLHMRPRPAANRAHTGTTSSIDAASAAAADSEASALAAALAAASASAPGGSKHVHAPAANRGRVMHATFSGAAPPPPAPVPPGAAASGLQPGAQSPEATTAAMQAQAAAMQAQAAELLNSAVTLTHTLAGSLLAQVQNSEILGDAYAKTMQVASKLSKLAAEAAEASAAVSQGGPPGGAPGDGPMGGLGGGAGGRAALQRSQAVVDVAADGSFTVEALGVMLFEDEAPPDSDHEASSAPTSGGLAADADAALLAAAGGGARVSDVWLLRGPADVEQRLFRAAAHGGGAASTAPAAAAAKSPAVRR